jgi:hypothetical protein
MDKKNIANNRPADIANFCRPQPPKLNPFRLMFVVSSAAISGSSYRWLYKLQPARVGNSPSYDPELIATELATYDGLSMSELSNDIGAAKCSYGVLISNLPTGIVPVKIPSESFVLAMSTTTLEGKQVYLIVNTQAVDGACPV